MPMSRTRTAATAILLLAGLAPALSAQTFSVKKQVKGEESLFSFNVGLWYTRIENRARTTQSIAQTFGPVLNGRMDVLRRWSIGVNYVYLRHDFKGSMTDPYLLYWITPRDEGRDLILAAFLGHHTGRFDFKGPQKRFVFPSGQVNHFHDSGVFGGIQGWYDFLPNWDIKGLIGWYPQVPNSNFFDSEEMHPIYALGIGHKVARNWEISLMGAVSPIQSDALIFATVTFWL